MVPFSGWMKPESPRGFWFWQRNAEVGFSNGYGTEEQPQAQMAATLGMFLEAATVL